MKSRCAKKDEPMTGYSGTPLVKKLGIKAGAKMFVEAAPKNYLKLVGSLPQGAKVLPRLAADTDFIHIFSTGKVRLQQSLHAALPKLTQDGTIWVSWPKKAAQVPTDVTEDTIR